MMVSPQLLSSCWRIPLATAEKWAAPISDACAFYAINTTQRLASFLAQTGHESGSGKHTAELWGPTDAQQRYEGRADLGNTEPGDGYRFRGRGLIQTTGRANYAELTRRLRARGVDCPDFERDPDELQAPWWAALSAADYWDSRNCNALADAGDFAAITRKINGGLNGQADRMARWEVAKDALADLPQQEPKEVAMPIPAVVGALLPVFAAKIPELLKLATASADERKDKAAELAVDVITRAVGATNAQHAAEMVASDPVAATAARKAVQEHWFDLAEAGGGGIAGAREADAQFAAGQRRLWDSPAFWALMVLLPLAYMIVGSIVGLWGGVPWSDDVRAAIATAVVSLIIGGAAGYYWGGTTTANARAAPPAK